MENRLPKQISITIQSASAFSLTGPDHDKEHIVLDDAHKREKLKNMNQKVFVIHHTMNVDERIEELKEGLNWLN